jgi:hypothetical protein
LGGLTRTRFAGKNHHLVIPDRRFNVLATLTDRELFWKYDMFRYRAFGYRLSGAHLIDVTQLATQNLAYGRFWQLVFKYE